MYCPWFRQFNMCWKFGVYNFLLGWYEVLERKQKIDLIDFVECVLRTPGITWFAINVVYIHKKYIQKFYEKAQFFFFFHRRPTNARLIVNKKNKYIKTDSWQLILIGSQRISFGSDRIWTESYPISIGRDRISTGIYRFSTKSNHISTASYRISNESDPMSTRRSVF